MLDFIFCSDVISNRLLFLFIAICASFGVKIYLLALLFPQGIRAKQFTKPWFFLMCIIIGSLFGDLAWIIKLLRKSIAPEIPYATLAFFIRLSWAMLIIQYQALSLFMESLVEKDFRIRTYNKVMVGISSIISGYFFWEAWFDSRLVTAAERSQALSLPIMQAPIEIRMMHYTGVYILIALAIPSFISTCFRLRSHPLPAILHKQIKTFLFYCLTPYVLIEALIAANMSLYLFKSYYYPIVTISTFWLAFALYYCIKRVICLRFLNTSNHVHAPHSFNFINDFTEILASLSHVTNFDELRQVTQCFVGKALGISLHKSTLYIRAEHQKEGFIKTNNSVETIIEHTLSASDTCIHNALHMNKILIYDELAFSNFYNSDTTRNALLAFLEAINADIFLPLYEKEIIVAYIIVERYARPHLMYTSAERDELLIFSNYAANFINLMQHRSLESLIHQEKELHEELYSKQCEINQYKESMRSFIHTNKSSSPGIMFYKNRHFIFANQSAKDMLSININAMVGHPTAKTLKALVRSVEEYKEPRSCCIYDKHENKVMVSATPNLEATHIILTISYPDITDIIAKHSDQLKDPTQWDYVLYLETTKSGQLINQLIPGSGPKLLSFKIELLKLALGNKALLLEVPEEDALPFVELIHHISVRSILQTITLKEPCRTTKETIELFGINELFSHTHYQQPLLEKLDETGTIFIKNIHFLPIETQELLAEFLASGFYREYKGTKKHASAARIICSTNQNLQALVHERIFSAELFKELRKASLSMPSLSSLSDNELIKLTDGFTEQAIQSNNFQNLLALTEKEKDKLACSRPLSLQELKARVQNILIQKSKKNDIYHETQFDPAFTVTNPELITAARLGKQALRDPKIMALLWATFKNQSKIAAFLGVNRSSVNRRCKKNAKEFFYAP